MNWDDTPQQAEFRNEIRVFLRDFPEHYTPDLIGENSLEPEDVPGYNWAADRLSDDRMRREGALKWAGMLAERGWISPHWPLKYGGASLGVMESFILHEEMMRAQVPTVNGIGAFLLGPTLLEHGSTEQCERYLLPISQGEVTWAQGFSEPGAGSDLAGITTRAVRAGDHYIVNGQKVWTSLAQHSDWLFALVRTDPDAPRHKGISYLLIDLRSEGITVRPIKDIRGAQPFAEIFLDDVEVPVNQRVGDENAGWSVAMSTLNFERSSIGATVRYENQLAQLINFVRSEDKDGFIRSDFSSSVRQDIAQRYIESRVMRALALYNASLQASGETPTHEASINQLFSAEFHQRLARTGAKAFGAHAALWQREASPMNAMFTHEVFDAVAHTFMGGSSEIQRNVIARRGLGLPKS